MRVSLGTKSIAGALGACTLDSRNQSCCWTCGVGYLLLIERQTVVLAWEFSRPVDDHRACDYVRSIFK